MDWQDVGVVQNGYTEDGAIDILNAVFDEINGAYMTAHNGEKSLKKVDFASYDHLDDYVMSLSYERQPLCMMFGWEEFKPEENTFSIKFGYNVGVMYPSRLPQYEFEESLYS